MSAGLRSSTQSESLDADLSIPIDSFRSRSASALGMLFPPCFTVALVARPAYGPGPICFPSSRGGERPFATTLPHVLLAVSLGPAGGLGGRRAARPRGFAKSGSDTCVSLQQRFGQPAVALHSPQTCTPRTSAAACGLSRQLESVRNSHMRPTRQTLTPCHPSRFS
jgi:hypothetical protein